jgi:hypothetical protein
MEDNPFNPRSPGGSAGSRSRFSWKASLVFGWVAFLVLLCLFVVWHKVTNEDAQLSTQANEQVDTGDISLPDLNVANDSLASSAKDKTLEVNGQLKVNNSLVFDPSDPPSDPVKGQVYYDKTSNVPMYYDGERFVAVATAEDVADAKQPSVQIVEPDNRGVVVEIPDDVAQTEKANTFTNDNLFMKDVAVNGFTALQSTSIASLVLSQPLGVASGGTGAASFASGSVVVGNGTGALSSVSAGSTGLCLMSTSGTPSFQVCPSGGSTPNAVTSTVNTNGNLARFGAGNTIVDSLLSDNGSTVSVAGNLQLGANALQLGNSGFGMTLNTTTLSANRTIQLPDASGTVCLQSSSSCGFVTGTPANFIQNQNSAAQTSTNYWVAGVGRADGGLIGPSFDTATNGVLSIGGNASSIAINDDTTVNGTMQVVTNTASINTPAIKVEQTGAGDSTVELKDGSGNSFYIGMDRSAGSVLRIGSSTNAQTTTSIGRLVAGGGVFQNVDNQIITKKVTTGPSDSGTLSSIAIHLSSIGVASGVKVGLYAHDAANNRPGTLIAATSTSTSGSVGWNLIPLSAPVANNTTYWIAINIESPGTGVSYDYCGGCGGEATSTYPRAFSDPWPTTHGAPTNVLDSQNWSFHMNVASGGVNDTFAGAKLFSMTDTGALTLQNGVNTTSAFQIQNAAGDAIVNLNTVSGVLSVQDQLVDSQLTVGGNLYSTNIDTSAPGTLTIGGVNAGTVNIAANNSGHTVNIANGTGTQMVTVGSLSNSSGLNLQAGSQNINITSNSVIYNRYQDEVVFGNTTGTNHFGIAGATGNIYTTYESSMTVGGGFVVQANTAVFNAGIRITNSGGSFQNYTTPGGALLQSAINIPNYTLADYGTILAMGITSASPDTARALLVADARTAAHQPTIGILSPNENQIYGLSWEGSNSTAYLKSSEYALRIRLSGNQDVAHFDTSNIYLNRYTNATAGLTVNTNSNDAFVVQNASAVELLKANTNTLTLTARSLDVAYNLTVYGDIVAGKHIIGGGAIPTTVTGGAACTSPTVSVTGTDTSGVVTVVAGSGCGSTGAIMAVVFANAFTDIPKVTLTPATSATAALQTYVDYGTMTYGAFDISTNTPLTNGATYRWFYHAIQ